jgi:replicative DNA helicase
VLNGEAKASDHDLKAADFGDSFLRDVFSACVQLELQGKTADLVTVSDVTGLDAVALVELATEARPDGALAKQHAENIRSVAQRRRLTETLVRAAQVTQDASQPLEDIAAKLRSYLDRMGAQSASGDTVAGLDAMLEFNAWLESKELDAAIPTGLSRLDIQLGGGLKGGRFYVIGARPGVGKSALMSNMAVHAVCKGYKALYVSLEMDAREIVTRMIASVSGVSVGKMEGKMLTDGDTVRIVESYALMPGDNFRFSTMARTPDAVRRAALQMRAREGLDVLFVDYLQLLHADGKPGNRVEAVGEISRSLKLLAMELGIPVVTAAQLNRASVNAGAAPKLSDLRESGSIEQDADVVLLLHAAEESFGVRNVDLKVAKNRQGTCGKTSLIFDGSTMRFRQEAM